jgi:UDP-glucuronate 4-epimerase
MKTALITGGAGFIGSHLVDRLLREGWRIDVLDNFDPFYPRAVKMANLRSHISHPSYRLIEADIQDSAALEPYLDQRIDCIVHLAARAGVRPSIADPVGYHQVNAGGTQNLLEFARKAGVKQFIFASSSSVYGVNPRVPWSEKDADMQPISPYASTKLSGEFLGHVYSHLYNIRFIALRFFTVYGPRQRPDLAIHKFGKSILTGRTIQLFGDGTTRRDYTHVSDIVAGIRAAIDYDATNFEIFNLGNNYTVELTQLIRELEKTTGKKARIEYLPEQAGDVPQTWADISKAAKSLGYKPKTSINNGLRDFVAWLHAVEGDVRTFTAARA